MVATFSECVVITCWLPHTPVQIFFRLFEYTNWSFGSDFPYNFNIVKKILSLVQDSLRVVQDKLRMDENSVSWNKIKLERCY